jgi:predicted dithiol-disulfide oxidoreductase (DUF899 family)
MPNAEILSVTTPTDREIVVTRGFNVPRHLVFEKDYVFDGPHGQQNLKALFAGRRQLIVYQFMFDPVWARAAQAAPVL